MYLNFTLSMPSNNSWNGKWSGENDLYAIVHTVGRDKESKDMAIKILKKEYYSYNFGDGWRASIKVSQVNKNDAMRIRRKSQGFCGYNWMVDSILKHGIIIEG